MLFCNPMPWHVDGEVMSFITIKVYKRPIESYAVTFYFKTSEFFAVHNKLASL